MNELELLEELQHPNIVALVDRWRTESHYYIMLEYCNLGDLKKLIRNNGVIPEKNVRSITK